MYLYVTIFNTDVALLKYVELIFIRGPLLSRFLVSLTSLSNGEYHSIKSSQVW